jgi:hypothetical protein
LVSLTASLSIPGLASWPPDVVILGRHSSWYWYRGRDHSIKNPFDYAGFTACNLPKDHTKKSGNGILVLRRNLQNLAAAGGADIDFFWKTAVKVITLSMEAYGYLI